jgi:hypothetical protein
MLVVLQHKHFSMLGEKEKEKNIQNFSSLLQKNVFRESQGTKIVNHFKLNGL